MAEREKFRSKLSPATGPDRLNLPSSPECGEWETLLADALDGTLRPEDEGKFSSHLATCSSCTEMFEQARRGQEWLEFLAPEPEVPSYLLEKILDETTSGKLVMAGGIAEDGSNVMAMPPVWQRPGLAGHVRRFAEPRLLMTAAMAFFSIALTISMTGIRITGFKLSDLRPTAVKSLLEKRIMTASTPLIRYYDRLRIVYEVESRMRELRRNTEENNSPDSKGSKQGSGQGQPGGEGDSHRKDGGSKLDPNDAPQQTVNPPASLWSSDTLEASLRLPMGPGPTNRIESKGFPALVQGVVSPEKSVLAMPKWSRTCRA